MDSFHQRQRTSRHATSILAEASDDSTGPNLVSAIPMDDLSTLGNDTYTWMCAKPTHPSMYIYQAPRRVSRGYAPTPDRLVYLSPGSIFKDDLADGDDTTLTDEQPFRSRRRYYCMALLCASVLLGSLMGLIWALSENDAGSSSSQSLLPPPDPPFPSLGQSVSPTILSFSSPVSPITNILPPVQPIQSAPSWTLPLPADTPLVFEEVVMMPPALAPANTQSVSNAPIESPTDTGGPRPPAPDLVVPPSATMPVVEQPSATLFQPMPTEQPSVPPIQPVATASGREKYWYPSVPLNGRDLPTEPTRSPLHRATMSPMDEPSEGPGPEPTKGSSSSTSDNPNPTRSPLPSDPSGSKPSRSPTSIESMIRQETSKPSLRAPSLATTKGPNVPPSQSPDSLPLADAPNPSTEEPSPEPSPAPMAQRIVSTESPTPKPSPNPTVTPSVESLPDPSPSPTKEDPNPETPEPTRLESTPAPTNREVTTPALTRSEAASPEPINRAVATPEPTIPEVETPEPTIPEVETPEPTIPEVETQEPTNHEVETPEPTNPEVETPEPTNPEVETPEPTNPEVETPEPTSPEVETPEPTNPEPKDAVEAPSPQANDEVDTIDTLSVMAADFP